MRPLVGRMHALGQAPAEVCRRRGAALLLALLL